MAVRIVPIKTRRMGFDMEARKFLTDSRAAKSFIDALIILRPTNSIPKPARIPPIFFTMSFLANAIVNAPIPAKVANTTPVEIEFSNIPSAVI